MREKTMENKAKGGETVNLVESKVLHFSRSSFWFDKFSYYYIVTRRDLENPEVKDKNE